MRRMFLGNFPGQMDNKGRVHIPVKFRDELSSGEIWIMRDCEPCIIVSPRQETPLSPIAKKGQLDTYSRIVIPVDFRKEIKLGSEIVIVGCGPWMEIWGKDQWQKEQEKLKKVK